MSLSGLSIPQHWKIWVCLHSYNIALDILIIYIKIYIYIQYSNSS